MIRTRRPAIGPIWLALVPAAALAGSPWLVAAPAGVGAARVAADDEDAEEPEHERALNRQAFVENCLMCHGEEMTSLQRLTAKQWGAEVEKMVNWGAPLPAERKGPMVEYLAELYGPGVPRATPGRIEPAAVADQGRQGAIDPDGPAAHADAGRGGALFATHCAACHGAEAKGGEVGINLVERPILAHEGEFGDLLRQGRRRMPGFAPALDAGGMGQILAWLRGRR